MGLNEGEGAAEAGAGAETAGGARTALGEKWQVMSGGGGGRTERKHRGIAPPLLWREWIINK